MTGARWHGSSRGATPIEVRGRAVAPALGFSPAELRRCDLDEDQAERLGLPVDRGRAGAVGCNSLRLHILLALDPDVPAPAAAPRRR